MKLWKQERPAVVGNAVDFDLVAELRKVPGIPRSADEFAPQRTMRAAPGEYSIERVESFLVGHIDDLRHALVALAEEDDAAREHLVELERRRAVLKIAHDAFTDTLAKLKGQTPAIEAAREEQVEEASEPA